MKTNRIQTLFMGLLLALCVAPCAFAQEAPLQGFDEYVNKALKDWEVPGVGVAIVKNDKVVLAKGYGVRKLGDPTPVDERTIFAIGSSSKAASCSYATTPRSLAIWSTGATTRSRPHGATARWAKAWSLSRSTRRAKWKRSRSKTWPISNARPTRRPPHPA